MRNLFICKKCKAGATSAIPARLLEFYGRVMMNDSASVLEIGWAGTDITPQELPVLLSGQFYARVSEGVKDPLKAVVCCFRSGEERAVLISCDLITIPDAVLAGVRERVAEICSEVRREEIICFATHTHTGPEIRVPANPDAAAFITSLGAAPVETYLEFLVETLAQAALEAWKNLAPSLIAYGTDYAVVGRNRRWVDTGGRSRIYLYTDEEKRAFHHLEGSEDHSLNVLATCDSGGSLTGLIVNIPCPAQEGEWDFQVSADFWHETRALLRARFGKDLHVLPQVSAAGELTSHLIYDKPANERMLKLRGRTAQEEIASRIADATGRILEVISDTAEPAPVFCHRIESIELPMNRLSKADAENSLREAGALREVFQRELAALEANPTRREQPRWYLEISESLRKAEWHAAVAARYDRQHEDSAWQSVEIHLMRLGGAAFATNPFEYYLDFGIQIKLHSPAVQTFLVQLAGGGTYLPGPRSVASGGYGAVAASNPVGPEGGRILCDHTVNSLRALFKAI